MYFGTAMLSTELPAPVLSPLPCAARGDTFVFDWLTVSRAVVSRLSWDWDWDWMSMHEVYVSAFPLGRPGVPGSVGHSHTQYRVYSFPTGASEGIAMSFWHQRSAPIS